MSKKKRGASPLVEPKDQEIELRNSERSTFTKCPQAWDWAYNFRYKPKTAAPALRFGTLVHSAMEAFYKPGIKRGPRPATTFLKLYEEELKTQTKIGFRDEDGTWQEAGQMGTVLLEAYYDKYGSDDQWRVLACEIPFRIPVTDPVTDLQFTYVGVMDLLMLDRASGKRKEIWVWDHKTCNDDPTKKGDILLLDEQSGSYWSYGVDYLIQQAILDAHRGRGLQGMLFNLIRKGKPDDRPQNKEGQYLNKPSKDALCIAYERKFKDAPPRGMTMEKMAQHLGTKGVKVHLLGEVSMKQPPPLFHREPVYRDEYDGDMVRKRINAQARMMHYMRTGKLEIYKVPGTLHNPHCKWCEFRDPCEIHETGGDYEHMFKSLYTTWEPYAQHEIDAGEKV